jgi:hypothetical protein
MAMSENYKAQLRDKIMLAILPQILMSIADRISKSFALPQAEKIMKQLHGEMEKAAEDEGFNPDAPANVHEVLSNFFAGITEASESGDKIRPHVREQLAAEASEVVWQIADAVMNRREPLPLPDPPTASL